MSKLIINDRIQIPEEELQITSVRSSGPGGQNVNKVNTKVILRWNLFGTRSLTPYVRRRLLNAVKNQISKEGWLTVTSQKNRSRYQNQTDCLQKLRLMILDAAKTPKRRRSSRPTLASQLKHRRNKQKKSDKKKLRQSPKFDG
ncbi:MAG: aminoacyl-tRNA hydrolase [Planctomycetaceae bacterium]|nr:aminoacyl-tRNA hydrolase [Planctomycetaceae bacterium]